ncbi:hypothetical protein J27TS8_35240 [Robertmurraya siralis]|uniref:Uncharacterized protein n=1 Tax=Robertmurraya siralis TaxID=77777 RepID=A0A920BVH1_9BACI|nr:hypothetical protein [Robertmurraya siralis]GIN63531.1 hypothetical protein J27TS8_35240 [Robertmurraya siralis]
MLEWTSTLIGFLIVFFIVGGVFFHFLLISLNTEDCTKIDRYPNMNE